MSGEKWTEGRPDRECPNCGTMFPPRAASSKYCSRRCAWDNNTSGHRKEGPIWRTNACGYIEGKIWVDGKRKRVKQHRWIMEQHLGRDLLRSEDVHHINGDKADNRVENLQIMDHGEHTRLTNLAREYASGYRLNLSDEERRARSERAKARHAAGKLMAPHVRAARARGEQESE